MFRVIARKYFIEEIKVVEQVRELGNDLLKSEIPRDAHTTMNQKQLGLDTCRRRLMSKKIWGMNMPQPYSQ